ncbi:MAG: M23 family metallopeptidase [Kurthia sp.]|nr:M23 family metallopeptidase [Candidatus Kurthia equi]
MKKKLIGSIFVLVLCISFASVSLAAQIFWPTQSTRVTSEYGMRTLNGVTKMHYGMDIGAKTAGVAGDSVKSIHNGVVYSAGWHSSYGNVVYINHNGSNQMNYVNVQSVYAHLNSLSVTTGNTVYGGTVIGTMGETGSAAQGVHLHLETRNCPTSACNTVSNTDATNPRTWLSGFITTSVPSLEVEEYEHESYSDLTVDSPNYYPYETLVEMSPQELKAIGYPNPYELEILTDSTYSLQ